ncbi:hypothetical protein COO60DRAFT_1033429 [Scenedesmus sp. NREL 46B-D3]|nr:hypothetical protein COO60DRAFT_1033429 [Scenedesmus sp. NREL 46B-D3]
MRRMLFLAACLLAGLSLAAANDIPIKFCAQNCKGDALVGLRAEVSGCTDHPFSCVTGPNGCCSIDKAPSVVKYCYGSAKNFCQWSVSGSDLDLAPNVKTLTRNGAPVTAAQYSCCKCDGRDYCPKVIYGDAATQSCPGNLGGILPSSSSGYFTVNFKPLDCSPPPTCEDYPCTSGTLKESLPPASFGLSPSDETCCTVSI